MTITGEVIALLKATGRYQDNWKLVTDLEEIASPLSPSFPGAVTDTARREQAEQILDDYGERLCGIGALEVASQVLTELACFALANINAMEHT